MKLNRSVLRRWVGGAQSLLGMWVFALCANAAMPLPDLDPRLKGAWPPYGRATAMAIVAGNDHAFLAAGEAGLLVFNVTNPSQPRHVGTLSMPGFASGIAISSEHVFVANRGMGGGTNRIYSGLEVIDVRDPSNPRAVARMAMAGPAVHVAVSGTRVAVLDEGFEADTGRIGAGLEVFEVQDPTQPTRLGRIEVGGRVGALAASDGIACFVEYRNQTPNLSVIDLSGADGPRQVGQLQVDVYSALALKDRHAFLAEDSHMKVVDLTDPARPKLIGESSWVEGASSKGLLIAGQYAFAGSAVLDISNLREPTEVGTIEGGFVGAMALAGNAMVCFYSSGGGFGTTEIDVLHVIDVSDPRHPQKVTTHIIEALASDVALSGSLAYVANRNAGLQILDVSNPEKPELVADHIAVGDVRRVAVEGTNAYLLAYGGMAVVDVSDPRHPRKRGVYQTEGSFFDLTVAGDRAFVSVALERKPGDQGAYTRALDVLDLSDPDLPRPLLRLDVEASPALVPVSPRFQYMPDATEGWMIHDVSDPGNRVRVGSYRAMVAALGGILVGNQVHTEYGEVFDVSDPAHPQGVGYSYPTIQARSGNLGCTSDREYGLQCYDLTDPPAPRLIGRYDLGGEILRTVELRGTDAFVAAGTAGLQIVDLSRPSGLIRAQTVSLPVRSEAIAVAIAGRHAYVAEGSAGLRILDITRPAEPVLVARHETEDFAMGIAVEADKVFVADRYAGLHIVDVSDPTRPRRVSTFATKSPASDVAVAGGYAYVALEGNGANNGPVYRGIDIIHVGDPRAPRKVGEYATEGRITGVIASSNRMVVSRINRYEFNSGQWSGAMDLVDITDPANPRRAGSFGTQGTATAMDVKGGIACVIDKGVWTGGEYAGAKMFVIDITDSENPKPLGEYPLAGGAGDSPRALILEGDHAFLDVRGVLHVVDLSDPAAPRRVNEAFPLRQSWGEYSDLAVAGTHLFAAADGVLKVVDITDLTRQRLLGGYSAGGYSELSELIPAGDYLLAPSGCSLEIISLSNPRKPQQLSVHVTRTSIAEVVVSGRFAYVAERGVELSAHEGMGGRLAVVDLNDPAHPREVGAFELNGLALDMAVSANLAVVASGERGLQAVDITDPTRPVEAGRLNTGGRANDVALVGSYALVAAEWGGLQVIDVSQPSQFRWVAGHQAYTHRIEVTNSRAYVWEEQELLVFDIADPARLRFINRIALSKGNPGSGDASVAGDYVFVVNESGLEILDLKDPLQPRRIAGNSVVDPWSSPLRFSGGTLFLGNGNNGVVALSVPPFFRSMSRTDGGISLEWESWGRARLQRATGISATTWQDVPGAESRTSAVLPLDQPNEFFRLKVQP